ncbi:MAG: 2-C-methyl-D-erythritol 4-phosphate cytidylyltransferase [Candidatus Aminicenantes bacterium]|nr:2-C-methyl-D-erythritol 4-phosphate cytidylyltransferase [Candidatus Aminicenantes bacterium]
MHKISVILVAAGEGQRFGAPKQFVPLNGKPVLEWCLESFETHLRIREIILVLMSDVQKKDYMEKYKKISYVVTGGKYRQDSVMAGFQKIDPSRTDTVLVHDGVRPLIGHDLISRVLQATKEYGAAIPVLTIEDTLKRIEGQKVLQTLDRSQIVRVQTPQGFSYPILKTALERARKDAFYGTDEAALVERIGGSIFLVPGDPRNLKITTPDDLKIAEAFCED